MQYWFGKRVHAGQERPGDVVFFDYQSGRSAPGQVGIVLDSAKCLMIVAPHTGDHVEIQSRKRYPGGTACFTRPSSTRCGFHDCVSNSTDREQ